ncbi:MAG: ABC transporter ATP-binding protein [Anaerolineales bacterium]|nr:ABC transporter ATP-binding protein [Anaerolineales bacterium]MCB8951357.1 ABC transporter ATP-binding protein [Ardenticatenales bacterium]
MSIVKTEQLTRVYGTGATAVTALNRLNVDIQPGEFVAVMGPSGCGKSTLLHLVGGLDKPSSGRVMLNGQDISRFNDDQMTQLRRRHIGFIFQFFNLIPVLEAVENAALPLILDGAKEGEARQKAETWLKRMGLGDRLAHRPDQLSGGEQQRVAIARALVAEPMLILADEPTGNLDSRSADEIAVLLRQISEEWQRTVLMVTHDPRIAAHANRIIFLKDGTMVDETRLSGNDRQGEVALRQKLEVAR